METIEVTRVDELTSDEQFKYPFLQYYIQDIIDKNFIRKDISYFENLKNIFKKINSFKYIFNSHSKLSSNYI